MAFENSIRVLQGFARKQVRDAKRNLKGSKNLARSITAQVIGSFEKSPVVQFKIPEYGGFVDTGVKGTGVKPTGKNAQPLKMKKPLNNAFANMIFGFKKGQPKFRKVSGKTKTGRKKVGMIPPSAIDKWMIQKGIDGTRDAKGRFISRSSIKFAMAISIHRQGLTGTGFFSKPLGQNLGRMYMNLEGAYAQDLKENLTKEKYFV
tara:strand:+ start:986 stop:1597 length:612 start_codon:yes stop_codon:yes gene_type:complete